jgi:hypothetical protein
MTNKQESLDENISYSLNECDYSFEQDKDQNHIPTDISQLMNEFENIELPENNNVGDENLNDLYASISNYDENYSVKQLQLICEFYGIKCGKVKKIDIIGEIVMFENDLKNIELVLKRNQFWNYMMELKADKFMKRFILWN